MLVAEQMKALSFFEQQKKGTEDSQKLAKQLIAQESIPDAAGAARANSSAMLKVDESSSSFVFDQ